MNDAANGRHIVILHSSSKSVDHELLGENAGENLGLGHQDFAQRNRPVNLGAIEHNTGRIDLRTLIGSSPLADGVEVLERKPDRVHQFMAARAGWIFAM